MVTISLTFKNLSDVANLTNTFGMYGNDFEYTQPKYSVELNHLNAQNAVIRTCIMVLTSTQKKNLA